MTTTPSRETLAEYEARMRPVVTAMRDHLLQRQSRPGTREAVVFDIDGTALSDNTTRHLWPPGVAQPAAFDCVLQLYNDARAMGYLAVFLTGRQECHRENTIRQLERAGYAGWHALIMYPTELPHTVAALEAWKDAERQKLEEGPEGVHLVACIGDQPMDVEGAHVGEHQARLPEPLGGRCILM